MSIEERRNSVLRSSISIKSIQKTIGSFQEGLTKAKTTSGEIVKQTRETNLFKSKLVSQDNKFFQQRRENVRRREREDELESASTTGVAKKQGNIITRSTKGFPMCGFSARVVEILNKVGVKFGSVNVLESDEMREGIKKYSNWPTIPQLYVKKEFIGGCDIITEMFESGELLELLNTNGIDVNPS